MTKARAKRSKKPLFEKLFQVRKAARKKTDIEDLPALGTLALALAVMILILTATDVLHLDLSELNARTLLVIGAGFLFFCMGVLAVIAKHRHTFPALYMLVAALMCSTFAGVFTWVALWAKGPFSGGFSVGPLALFNSTRDVWARIGFGIGAIVMIVLSCLAWWRWWRAVNGGKIDLN
ncbi:MAG: hypothetical protein ACREUJ_02060 [Burkholderiales bacterium]